MAPSEKQPTERGEIILERLGQLSWSIAELIRRSKLAKNTVNNALYGPREPSAETVRTIAEVLEIPVEQLARTGSVAGSPAESFSLRRWPYNVCLGVGFPALLAAVHFLDRGEEAIVQGIQAVMILLLWFLRPRPPEVTERASHRLRMAAAAARDLGRYWSRVWMMWCLLYVALAIATWQGWLPWPEGRPDPEQRWTLFVLNLLQNLATLLLFLCYEVTARPTIEEDLSRRRQGLTLMAMTAWIALTAVTVFEVVAVIADSPHQERFMWVSGFAQGVALALLVGRLDSKYVDPPTVVVGLLYFYAVIQGAWLAFRDEPTGLMELLTTFALGLKWLLFVFMTWLFESRVILFYLTRMRELDQVARRNREEFLRSYRAGDVEEL